METCDTCQSAYRFECGFSCVPFRSSMARRSWGRSRCCWWSSVRAVTCAMALNLGQTIFIRSAHGFSDASRCIAAMLVAVSVHCPRVTCAATIQHRSSRKPTYLRITVSGRCCCAAASQRRRATAGVVQRRPPHRAGCCTRLALFALVGGEPLCSPAAYHQPSSGHE